MIYESFFIVAIDLSWSIARFANSEYNCFLSSCISHTNFLDAFCIFCLCALCEGIKRQTPPPHPRPQCWADVMMGSGGRGFRGGRGGGGGGGGVPSFRGRGGGGGGRFGGRGMGRMDNRSVEPIGPRDPRSLVSYIDVDAPKVRKLLFSALPCFFFIRFCCASLRMLPGATVLEYCAYCMGVRVPTALKYFAYCMGALCLLHGKYCAYCMKIPRLLYRSTEVPCLMYGNTAPTECFCPSRV